MKERPILFSAPMVRAILEGRKTQTRRVVKPQPVVIGSKAEWAGPRPKAKRNSGAFAHWARTGEKPSLDYIAWSCKYGQPGDRLWVRETWADLRGMGFGNDPRTDKPFIVSYRADVKPGSDGDRARIDYGVKWKPSIHMPRWASRITLEITGIRVERLQDISNSDALDEGTPDIRTIKNNWDMVRCYQELWEKINGAGSWDVNPWVWVIEFKNIAEAK